MAHNLSAPWAEVVSGASYPMSVDELMAQIATLNVADSLDGLDVLPGFAYPLADLFS